MVTTARDNIFWSNLLINKHLESLKNRVVSGKLLHFDASTVGPPYGELLKVKTPPIE